MKEPIDAVITWVNGQDSNHQQKLANYLVQNKISRPSSAAPTRFNQYGEITFCIQALLYFAPWLRTIYIVTDAQIPAILQHLQGTIYAAKVKLIDHRAIFVGYEEYLPTFNSLSIESVLWRIEGLSKNFIYLNDDCIVIRPVRYEDFFHKDKLILRGEWKKYSERTIANLIKKHFLKRRALYSKNQHRYIQEQSAKLVKQPRCFFHLHHVPFSVNKKTLALFFELNPDLLRSNLSYPFRDIQQFWAISLGAHLEIQKKKAIFDKTLTAIMVNGFSHSPRKICNRLSTADKQETIKFLCVQSLDLASEKMRDKILGWLAQKIPSIL